MLLHTIGNTNVPGPVNPWISKYIFPGGVCLLALSEISPLIELVWPAVSPISRSCGFIMPKPCARGAIRFVARRRGRAPSL